MDIGRAALDGLSLCVLGIAKVCLWHIAAFAAPQHFRSLTVTTDKGGLGVAIICRAELAGGGTGCQRPGGSACLGSRRY